MSIVTDFATNCSTQSFAMIGAENVVVGADTISCVLSETDDSRDFTEGGFEVSKRLQAVCLTSALPSTAIIKKSATARGITFRVANVSNGGTFSTITLEEVLKG